MCESVTITGKEFCYGVSQICIYTARLFFRVPANHWTSQVEKLDAPVILQPAEIQTTSKTDKYTA
jgi:hypothetical protein